MVCGFIVFGVLQVFAFRFWCLFVLLVGLFGYFGYCSVVFLLLCGFGALLFRCGLLLLCRFVVLVCLLIVAIARFSLFWLVLIVVMCVVASPLVFAW